MILGGRFLSKMKSLWENILALQFTSTHFLHFQLQCPCSNSEVRNVRPNRSSICIRSVNTGEKDLIESIYNVLGIGKLWLETCFFFSREKDTYDVFNKLRSVTSYGFYGLKYVNFAVLDDLFDTSIGSAVHSSSGLTIPENCKQTADKNVNNIFLNLWIHSEAKATISKISFF